MLKGIFWGLLVLLFFITGCIHRSYVQDLNAEFNFDFEKIEADTPAHWRIKGTDFTTLKIDSTHVKSGRYALRLENLGDSVGYKILYFVLPHNYKGKFIRLSGSIKTENVTAGFAGLYARIDPLIAFDNMQSRGITGTTDWKDYEIILPLKPENTSRILVGGLLIGKGTVWFDNLQVTIDGKTLNDPTIEIHGGKEKHDREFDKGSMIKVSDVDPENSDNLVLLGHLWGFLKYYHPNIATGDLNWDYELFRVLPAYLKVKNTQQRDEILGRWIDKIGHFSRCTSCLKAPETAALKPDLSWLRDKPMSETLKDKILTIYANRNQGEHYYISLQPGVGNPNFKNENLYSDMPYPDAGYRLLALYRYWNIIHYFFPYKNLIAKDWNAVLKEYIPVFLNAKDELAYELAVLRLVGEIKDSHARLSGEVDKIENLRGHNYSPYKIGFIEDKWVITGYVSLELSDKEKLKIGDMITHINGKAIESIVDSLRPYYPHSNEIAMRKDMSSDLLRSSSNTIDLKYISANKPKQRKIVLYDQKFKSNQMRALEKKHAPTFRHLTDDIGYFTLETVEHIDVANLKKELVNLKGIVIDIRNYPKNFVTSALASLFVAEPTSFAKFSKANLRNPGEFNFFTGTIIQPSAVRYNFYDKNRKEFKGKVVVLVNENSISQSEFTAMALRAVPNCLIVGSTTAGADGDVSSINLPGGLTTMISGIGVYYPNGEGTQRKGIIPDVFVKPTISGLMSGKDEVLEKAIELLK